MLGKIREEGKLIGSAKNFYANFPIFTFKGIASALRGKEYLKPAFHFGECIKFASFVSFWVFMNYFILRI